MTVDDSPFFDLAQQVAAEHLARTGVPTDAQHVHLETADAYRFYQPVRGGSAVIVGRDGTCLFASSSVSPAQHEAAFVAGRRTETGPRPERLGS